MVTVNGDFVSSLNEQQNELLIAEVRAQSAFMGADVITSTVPTNNAAVRMTGIGSAGLPADTTGTGVRYTDPAKYNQLVQVLEYTAGFEVLRSAMEDDQIGWLPATTRRYAARMANEHRRLVLSTMASPGTAFDAVAFWSGAHSVGGQTIDNVIDVDVATTASPTIAEFQDGIQKAQAQMLSFTDDKGDKSLGLFGNVICVPPGYMTVAFQALNGMGTPGSVAPMPMPDGGLAMQVPGYTVLINPYLPAVASTAKFYLFHASNDLKPFAWAERTAPEMNASGPESDIWRNENKVQYAFRRRGVRYVGDPRLGVEVTFT